MIDGRIETFATAAGGKLYRGRCEVTNESVTAGEVMSLQLPDGPAAGFERVTLSWVNEQHGGASRCAFEVLDRRILSEEQS